MKKIIFDFLSYTFYCTKHQYMSHRVKDKDSKLTRCYVWLTNSGAEHFYRNRHIMFLKGDRELTLISYSVHRSSLPNYIGVRVFKGKYKYC